ncbi:DUF4398 domain-containing protein [Brucella anthropi]|uniref:hypothetical protein n=1 Tax=Brucella anthropi TaxID=529 RepID=UPI00124DAB25|nr:hypothetical protein [Brucella anthropi]KAB2757671.1 DUF4398 domain-containing protein [Brucella anthropi]
MPLSQNSAALLNNLIRNDVSQTLSGSKRFVRNGRWLGLSNFYNEEASKKVANDHASNSVTQPRHLAQYIAVSTLLHCSDGWSYLGRAIQAVLRGDPNRARHLAYYAELRAAMSLLASEGIGVFDKKHAIISGPHIAALFPPSNPTHTFVWDCLANWAQNNRSGSLFSSVIRPYGRSLTEWLLPINGQANLGAQANSWFMQWGMDLMMMADDRTARNHSSYRPEGIPGSWILASGETSKMVSDIWRLLEPSPTSPFETLDKYILRLSLESIFKSINGVTSARGPAFSQFISNVVAFQSMPEKISGLWNDFLTRRVDPQDPSILSLSKQKPNKTSKSAFFMISRAVLLLRVASGSASQTLKDAGFIASDIEFWWTELGPARGLWNDGSTPDSAADLWSDIEVAISSLKDFDTAHAASGTHSFYNLGLEAGEAVNSLGGFERPMVWSLLPA